MVRIGEILTSDLVVGSHLCRKGRGKDGAPSAGFVAHPGGLIVRPPTLSFEGVTGFFLDGAKYFSLGVRGTGRGGWRRALIGAKSK